MAQFEKVSQSGMFRLCGELSCPEKGSEFGIRICSLVEWSSNSGFCRPEHSQRRAVFECDELLGAYT